MNKKLLLFASLVLSNNTIFASGTLDAWVSDNINDIYEQQNAQEELGNTLFNIQDRKIPLRNDELKWNTDPLFRRIKFHSAIQDSITNDFRTYKYNKTITDSDTTKHRTIALKLAKDLGVAAFTCVAGTVCLGTIGGALGNAGYEAAVYHVIDRPEIIKRFRRDFNAENFSHFNKVLEQAQENADYKLKLIEEALNNDEFIQDKNNKAILLAMMSGENIPKNITPGFYGKRIPISDESEDSDFKVELIKSSRAYYESNKEVAKYAQYGLEAADILGINVPDELRTGINVYSSTVQISGMLATKNYPAAAMAGMQLLGSLLSKKNAVDPQFEYMRNQFAQINQKLDALYKNQKIIITKLDELADKIDASESRLTKLITVMAGLNRNLISTPYFRFQAQCYQTITELDSAYKINIDSKTLPQIAESFLDSDERRKNLYNCWEFVSNTLRPGFYSNRIDSILGLASLDSNYLDRNKNKYNRWSAEYIKEFELFPILRDFKSTLGPEEQLIDLFSTITGDIDFVPKQGDDIDFNNEFRKMFFIEETNSNFNFSSLVTQNLDPNAVFQVIKPILKLHDIISLTEPRGSDRRFFKEYLNPYKKFKLYQNTKKNKYVDQLGVQKNRINQNVINILYRARLHLNVAKYQASLWDGTGMIRQFKDILLSGKSDKLNKLSFILYGDPEKNEKYPGHKYLKENGMIYIIHSVIKNIPFGNESYAQAVASGNENIIDQLISSPLHSYLGSKEKLTITIKCIKETTEETPNICPSIDYGKYETGFEITLNFGDQSFKFPLPGWHNSQKMIFKRVPEVNLIGYYEEAINSLISDYSFSKELTESIFTNKKERKAFIDEHNILLILDNIKKKKS